MQSSETWGMYFSNMSGHPAMTVFDDGISQNIDEVQLPNSIKVKLHLNDVRVDGLPSTEEGERLMEIGPIIEDAISSHGGLFLGRVTTNSVRWNIGLAPQSTEEILSQLELDAGKFDFRYEVFVEPDPSKAAYWEDLYPTADDRQVMADMYVKRVLTEQGDDQYAERKIEHWTIFEQKTDAEKFAEWGNGQGYLEIEVFKKKDGLLSPATWLVRFSHSGTMVLNDITHHTLKLSNQARTLNGTYDGWETQITN